MILTELCDTRHVHISHNAPYLPPPKFCKSIVFNKLFLLGWLKYSGEMKNKGYVKFWGANKVELGRCASGVSQHLYVFPSAGSRPRDKGGPVIQTLR